MQMVTGTLPGDSVPVTRFSSIVSDRPMNEKCPHCGVVVPLVRDPFCPDCRGALDEASPDAARQPSAVGKVSRFRLSAAGKLIVKLHLVAALVGIAIVIVGILEYGSPGRYPVVFLVIPVFLTAALACGASMAVLRWWGVATFVPADEVSSDTPDSDTPS